jgi:hypothetical protein
VLVDYGGTISSNDNVSIRGSRCICLWWLYLTRFD